MDVFHLQSIHLGAYANEDIRIPGSFSRERRCTPDLSCYTHNMKQLGVDIVAVARIRALGERYGERFLNRVYSPSELASRLNLNDQSANQHKKQTEIPSLRPQNELVWQGLATKLVGNCVQIAEQSTVCHFSVYRNGLQQCGKSNK